MYHKAVLLKESIELLRINENGTYADATFGGGSHSGAILERLGNGRIIAFDQDAAAQNNVPKDARITLIQANFRHIKNYLGLYKIEKVDGILADLGISSHQIDEASRGFSTRSQGPLDMRMDNTKELTAATVVNEYPREKLTDLFRRYGDVENASTLASRIEELRRTKMIATTDDLAGLTRSLAPRGKENQYLAKVFQAIRIEVNDEMDALEEFLEATPDILKPGGRLVVISYHSLEDRMVKNFMRSGNTEGRISKDFFGNPLVPFSLVTRKAIVPSEEETNANNRARSAKLRAAERI
jgi:16S rRNA (cytosine1402-N4)-methyltransferase